MTINLCSIGILPTCKILQEFLKQVHMLSNLLKNNKVFVGNLMKMNLKLNNLSRVPLQNNMKRRICLNVFSHWHKISNNKGLKEVCKMPL